MKTKTNVILWLKSTQAPLCLRVHKTCKFCRLWQTSSQLIHFPVKQMFPTTRPIYSKYLEVLSLYAGSLSFLLSKCTKAYIEMWTTVKEIVKIWLVTNCILQHVHSREALTLQREMHLRCTFQCPADFIWRNFVRKNTANAGNVPPPSLKFCRSTKFVTDLQMFLCWYDSLLGNAGSLWGFRGVQSACASVSRHNTSI